MGALVAGATALAVSAGVTASTASTFATDDAPFAGEGQTVTYRGLALEVPRSWKVHDLEDDPSACVRNDQQAVYLGTPGEDQDCPARAVGRADAIHIQPSTQAVNFAPDAQVVQPGQDSSRAFASEGSGEARMAMSGTGLSVTASYSGSPGRVRSIIDNASYDGPRRSTVQAPKTGTSTPQIPNAASATRGHGRGFDTCAAPSKDAMDAWKSSPFRTVGVYIGGMNRACGDGNLSRSWVQHTTGQGWRVLPIYVGRQAKCALQTDMASITDSKATAQGRAAAEDAVQRAKNFGLGTGSTLYNDMEGYGDSSSCRKSVLRFLNGWTKRLHQLGYLSGVYSSASSGIRDFANNYHSDSFARPDVIWMADWDNDRSLWGSKYVSDDKWSRNQRVKQYRGPHTETYGGHSIEIDSNFVDAMTGTVPQGKNVTAKESLNVRTGPSTSYDRARGVAPGSNLNVACQVSGQKVGSTKVWNKLAGGGYVSNAYVNTGGGNGFSGKLPRCQFPYQVTTDSLRARSGPSTNHKAAGSIAYGGLANVVCQRKGEEVGKSRVWNRLENGKWVSDAYVASPGRPGFTDGIPRC